MTALIRPRLDTVPSPVFLDPSAPHATLTFIAWLRDRHTDAVEVSWPAVVDPGLDTTLLFHLPPPAPAPEARGVDAVWRWRAAHRPAMCYYRVGPGFIQVKDVRQAETAARFVLEDPSQIGAFTRCLEPCRLTNLAPGERAAARMLVGERLLLQLDDWVTTLPSRMRHWPVPSHLA